MDKARQYLGIGRKAYMYLCSIHQEDRFGPVPAPEGIGYHLCFVDHGHIVAPGEVAELDSRSGDLRAAGTDEFLAGQKLAEDSLGIEGIVHFQREQPQRTQIDTGAGSLQSLQGIIGLSGVGRTDVQDEPAVHPPGPFAVLFDIEFVKK